MSANPSNLINIRPMNLSDLNTVDSLENEVYEYPWSKKIIKDCILYQYNCYVAVKEFYLIGYIIFQIMPSETHILNLTVKEKYRRNGLASEFMELVINESKNRNSNTIILETRKNNNPAINLYKKYNFNKIGIRKNYYQAGEKREDALVYQKILSNCHLD